MAALADPLDLARLLGLGRRLDMLAVRDSWDALLAQEDTMNRRNFLGWTATGAAGLFLPQPVFPRRKTFVFGSGIREPEWPPMPVALHNQFGLMPVLERGKDWAYLLDGRGAMWDLSWKTWDSGGATFTGPLASFRGLPLASAGGNARRTNIERHGRPPAFSQAFLCP
jgi:hypothetical protein